MKHTQRKKRLIMLQTKPRKNTVNENNLIFYFAIAKCEIGGQNKLKRKLETWDGRAEWQQIQNEPCMLMMISSVTMVIFELFSGAANEQ